MSKGDSESNEFKLTWLHLSDTHLLPSLQDSYKSDKVITALIKTLREEAANGEGPDLIFFTGDLANEGKDYGKAEEFFNNLLSATGLQEKFKDSARKYLFIVPGNHDVDQKCTKFLKRPLDDSEQSVEFFSPDNAKCREPYLARFHSYSGFFNKYFNQIRQISLKNIGTLKSFL